jgi:hypothetical protein
MSPVHGLQILHGIPVVVDKDDGIGTCQIETETSDRSGQQEDIDARIGIVGLHNGMSLFRVDRTVHAHVCHGRHVLRKEGGLDQVEHWPHLTKDQDSVTSVLFLAEADTAIVEQLSVSAKPWENLL